MTEITTAESPLPFELPKSVQPSKPRARMGRRIFSSMRAENTGWGVLSSELKPRRKSEMPVERSSLIILEGKEQTDEDLINSFEKARRAGEFKELDCKRIYQRELRRSVKDCYRASTQNLDDIQRCLEQLYEDIEESKEDFHEHAVHFSSVKIHEHPIIVGDNPGGRIGAPITIDWNAISETSIDISKYEHARDGHRRGSRNIRMTAGHRMSMLTALGFPLGDIEKAAHLASKIRTQREATRATLRNIQRHERAEKVRHFISNVMSLGRKKREERTFLAQYRVPQKA